MQTSFLAVFLCFFAGESSGFDHRCPSLIRIALEKEVAGHMGTAEISALVKDIKVIERGDNRFSHEQMIAMLFGNRKFELRSWKFSKELEELTNSGVEFEQAVDIAEAKVLEAILTMVRAKGAEGYAEHQLHSTLKGLSVEQKKALDPTGVFFDAGEGAATAYSVVNARELGLRDLSVVRVDPQGSFGVPKTRDRRWGGTLEYVLFSHVPWNQVQGLGLAKISDKSNWLFLEVKSRRSDGVPKEIEVYRSEEANGAEGSLRSTEKLAVINEVKTEITTEGLSPDARVIVGYLEREFGR